MEQLFITFAGGIVGALLMDLAEMTAAKRGISSNVNVALVGRWVVGLLRGKFQHNDIRRTPGYTYEITVGWLFHLFIAGGGVALLLPLAWDFGNWPIALTNPLPYILFGLATSALPWFILLPSFGWGVWGHRGPEGSNALLASSLSHIPYGLGIWLTVFLFHTTPSN
jgi:hypothetical protein